jgi:hypothetical protein
MNKLWQVWKGENIENVIFEGSETAARRYYKSNGGIKSNLHLGYEILNLTNQ